VIVLSTATFQTPAIGRSVRSTVDGFFSSARSAEPSVDDRLTRSERIIPIRVDAGLRQEPVQAPNIVWIHGMLIMVKLGEVSVEL